MTRTAQTTADRRVSTSEYRVLEAVSVIGACGPGAVFDRLESRGVHYSYGHVVEIVQRLWLNGHLRRIRRGLYAVQADPTPEQRRRAQEIVRLRRDGLTVREIAALHGISHQRVQQIYARHATEDDVAAAAERRLELRSERVEARRRARRAEGDRRRRRRDERKDQILRDVRAWYELFGEPPAAADWNDAPASRKHHAWRAERYDATGRRWPKARSLQYYFGSWNAAVAAAGLTPRKRTDPKRHDHRRHGDRRVKTHCRHGHELAGENLYVSPRGKRACRTCTRDATRRYQRNKRA